MASGSTVRTMRRNWVLRFIGSSVRWSRGSSLPDPKWYMPRSMSKIRARRKQEEIVPNAKPCDQGVYRLDLNAFAATRVANLGRFDMVVAVRGDHRQDRESFDDGVAGLGPRKALEQLLEHQAGGIGRFARAEGASQSMDLGSLAWRIPAKSQ